MGRLFLATDDEARASLLLRQPSLRASLLCKVAVVVLEDEYSLASLPLLLQFLDIARRNRNTCVEGEVAVPQSKSRRSMISEEPVNPESLLGVTVN